MAEHHLKVWPEPYDAIKSGAKTFEFRRDDRGYAVGDILILEKWDPHVRMFCGAPIKARVTYLLRGQFGVPADYVAMSIEIERGHNAD